MEVAAKLLDAEDETCCAKLKAYDTQVTIAACCGKIERQEQQFQNRGRMRQIESAVTRSGENFRC